VRLGLLGAQIHNKRTEKACDARSSKRVRSYRGGGGPENVAEGVASSEKVAIRQANNRRFVAERCGKKKLACKNRRKFVEDHGAATGEEGGVRERSKMDDVCKKCKKQNEGGGLYLGGARWRSKSRGPAKAQAIKGNTSERSPRPRVKGKRESHSEGSINRAGLERRRNRESK